MTSLEQIDVAQRTGGRPTGIRGWAQRLTQEQIVLGVTVLLVIIFSIMVPGFARLGNIGTLLNNISIVGILALGTAIVIIGRGLDISQVGSMVVGAAIAALLMDQGWALGWAIAGGLAATTLIGLINGYVIAFIEMPPLFATLAVNLILFGVTRMWIVGSSYIFYLPDSAHAFLELGARIGGIPLSVFVFFGLAAVAHLFLSRTRIGHFIYAHGDNPEAARLTGISVRSLTMIEYVICADIGCIAGFVLMGMLGNIDTQMMAGSMIFNVILVAVLGGVSLVGGRGGILSVVAGALLIGVLLNGMTLLNLNSDVQNVVRGLVLLGAIVLDNRLHPRDEETARQGE